jgi:deoxyribose-phosphate aldolase
MKLAKLIESTNVNPTANRQAIIQLCNEAIEHDFYAVAVLPYWIPIAVDVLNSTSVRIATGISFPFGGDTTKTKVFSAKQAIQYGANAVDMVINIGALKSGYKELVKQDIVEVVQAVNEIAPGTEVKVIIECCYLNDHEKKTACAIVASSGADFVKTSTGFGPSGATVADVRFLRSILPPSIKIKAAGMIRNKDQALSLIEAGATRIGTSAAVKIVTSGSRPLEINHVDSVG